MLNRRATSKYAESHGHEVSTVPTYRRSSRVLVGHRTFVHVAFFCGIVAFSIINMVILKNESLSRMELAISERVVTVPTGRTVVRKRRVEPSKATASEETKTLDASQFLEKSEILHEPMISDSDPVDPTRDHHESIGGSARATTADVPKRPDALTLAHENMKKLNINITYSGQDKPPVSFTSFRRPRAHGSGLKGSNFWYDDPLFDNVSMPSDFILAHPRVDPLSNLFNSSLLRRIEMKPEVQNLGVLLDAGRHYFNVHWIHRMIDVLAALNYNFLHFRLTDDQSFNVLLESQPLLAYPSALHNNTQVYSPRELRDIVRYAKAKGIQVIPEINVPGHAGSWGGIPDLIVQCPKFICKHGYGVPMNVSNPNLYPILRDVLSEVVDIFDRPPYLHLGGDEVHMAETCFEEVGEELFNYNEFERMLGDIVKDIGYNESQIIRWETTGSVDKVQSPRTGGITHFWFEQPGKSPLWRNKYGTDFNDPVFLSTGLYFDTNTDDSAWEVYVKTKQLKHLTHTKSPILGIIAATFELDSKFWLDRNVVGRLLAVSLGTSSLNVTSSTELYGAYKEVCSAAGFDNDLCSTYGRPPMPYPHFRSELKDGKQGHVVWKQWIDDICKRFAYQVPSRGYNPRPTDPNNNSRKQIESAKEKFWTSIYKDKAWQGRRNIEKSESAVEIFPPFSHADQIVEHAGIMFDVASHPTSHTRLNSMVSQVVSPMGLNMIQLRLVDDTAFAYHSVSSPFFFNGKPHTDHVRYPSTADLNAMSKTAGKFGVGIMPEISISTNAGGWFHSNYNVECGEFLCQHGRYIPQDIHNPDYLPTIFGMIRELLQFTSSPFIHLGYDEREKSSACFHEARGTRQAPKFDEFETSLGNLLEFIGVTNDRVVRWQNHERVQYPSRIGHITQFPAGSSIEERIIKEENPWVGTIDVRKGGLWQVYSTTRAMAAKSPAAIIAQIGDMGGYEMERDATEHRLIAFRMGLRNKGKMTESHFLREYPNICSSYFEFQSSVTNKKNTLSRNQALCKAFTASSNDAPSLSEYNEQEFWNQTATYFCEERTRPSMKMVFKDKKNIPTAVSIQTKYDGEVHVA